jgi:transposase
MGEKAMTGHQFTSVLDKSHVMMAKGKNIVTTAEAAKMIGVSLRTIRYWEAQGQTPPRTPPGSYPRGYRLKDIEAFAKVYRLKQALVAIGLSPEQAAEVMTLTRLKRREMLVKWGFPPSLWV